MYEKAQQKQKTSGVCGPGVLGSCLPVEWHLDPQLLPAAPLIRPPENLFFVFPQVAKFKMLIYPVRSGKEDKWVKGK